MQGTAGNVKSGCGCVSKNRLIREAMIRYSNDFARVEVENQFLRRVIRKKESRIKALNTRVRNLLHE
jgi:hypothetical protein